MLSRELEIEARQYLFDCFKDGDGWAIICGNNVCSWIRELGAPHRWVAGVFAINSVGELWQAQGGNDYDGAREWVKVRPQ